MTNSLNPVLTIQIWSPPESLRKEVEEKVYHSLVDRRIKAGEDPYPVSYCKQVSLIFAEPIGFLFYPFSKVWSTP